MNVALNGLIREGVIAAFETNFDGISVLGILHIADTAPLITDRAFPATTARRSWRSATALPKS